MQDERKDKTWRQRKLRTNKKKRKSIMSKMCLFVKLFLEIFSFKEA